MTIFFSMLAIAIPKKIGKLECWKICGFRIIQLHIYTILDTFRHLCWPCNQPKLLGAPGNSRLRLETKHGLDRDSQSNMGEEDIGMFWDVFWDDHFLDNPRIPGHENNWQAHILQTCVWITTTFCSMSILNLMITRQFRGILGCFKKKGDRKPRCCR